MERYFFGGGNVDAATGYVPPAGNLGRTATRLRGATVGVRRNEHFFSISSSEVWRTSFLDHVDHVFDMFLAWSPMRSIALATNRRSIKTEMVRGSQSWEEIGRVEAEFLVHLLVA